MEVFVVSLLNGLVYGMLLFMLASGLTLILSMMCVLNFAHASAYMLGAYFAYTISLYLGFWHFVAAGEIMSREQEHLLNACFLSRLQKTLCATLWWTE